MSSTIDRVADTSTGAQRTTWQARKSEATRTAILDAVIEAYVDVGYGRTTLQQISDRTGLSRGAIVHHFPSMQEITGAAIRRLHDRRLAAYRESLEAISPDVDFVDAAIDSLWEQLNDPLFTAYQELSVAARTDPDLATILRPAQVEYERQWHEAAHDHSHAPTEIDDRFGLTTDLARVLVEGMATCFMADDGEIRKKRLLAYLKLRVREILESGPDEELIRDFGMLEIAKKD